MKLSNYQLRNDIFFSGLKKIAAVPMKSARAAVNVAKLAAAVEREAQAVQNAYISILKAHLELDAAGNIVETEGQAKVLPDKEASFMSTMKDFHELEVEIEADGVSLDDIESCQLTAQEVIALGQIIKKEE